MKFCRACNLEKSLAEFGRDRSRSDGLCDRCKECNAQRSRVYYQGHREQRAAYDAAKPRKRVPPRRGVCAECGGSFQGRATRRYCSEKCSRQAHRARHVGVPCVREECDRGSYLGGLCRQHYELDHTDRDRTRARWRAQNHKRRTVSREGDVTPAYELMLRTRAKRCPMPDCNVKLVDGPYLPASKELDHIVPINIGGTHTIGNVRIICRKCNLRRPGDGSDYTGPVTLWAEAS